MNLTTMPTLALAHLSVLDVPPLELVTLAANVGYAAIGLRLYPAFPGSVFYELPVGSTVCRQMQQRLKDEGVVVNDIEFIGIGEHFNAAQLQGLLDTASALGAQRLNVCGDDFDRARLTENFAHLCEISESYGLRVELEYMSWRAVKNFEDAVEVVAGAGKPNGGVLIDVLHLSRTGGSIHDVQRAPGGIHFVQLCDVIVEHVPQTPEALLQEARSGRLAPGRGTLPLRELLAELEEGTALSLEVPTNGNASPQKHALDIFQSTRKMLASIEEAVC